MFLLGNKDFIPQNKENRFTPILSIIIKRQGGLTIVELLLALAILGLVLTGGFSFLFFGWSSFDRGTDRAVVQNNLRMAAEEITNEVRYVDSISIVDSAMVPDPVSNDDFYIFINDENRIEKKSATASTIIPHELDSNLILELNFIRETDRRLKVVVKESGNDMEIETVVNILNGNIADTASSGNAVRVESNGSGGNIEFVAVTGVTLSELSYTLQEGQNFTLPAQVQPSNASNQAVTWNSSDGAIATVDSNGLVTGVSSGTATITVITVDGGFETTCAVTVESVSEPDPVPLAINTDNPPNATKNTHYPGYIFTVTGGVTPYSFSKTNGVLPEGMSLNNDSLEGTPEEEGNFTFTITVIDNESATTEHVFTLVVDPDYEIWTPGSYGEGLIVFHNGAFFEAHHWTTAEPGTSDHWQELTDEWRFFNTYIENEEVWHNGNKYRAKHWTRGDEPGVANVWELITGNGNGSGPEAMDIINTNKKKFTLVFDMPIESTEKPYEDVTTSINNKHVTYERNSNFPNNSNIVFSVTGTNNKISTITVKITGINWTIVNN